MRSCCMVLFHRLTGRPETPEVDETQPVPPITDFSGVNGIEASVIDETQPVPPITEASIPFTPEKSRKIGPLAISD